MAEPDGRAGAGLIEVATARSEAERLVARGRAQQAAGDDVDARGCFDAAIDLDQSQSAAIDEAGPPAGTASESAASRWDAFHADWVAPAARVALPALSVLIVLLVVARVLTGKVVDVGTVVADATAARASWWAGVLLLGAAALCATVLGPSGDPVWGVEAPAVSQAVVLSLAFASGTALAVAVHRAGEPPSDWSDARRRTARTGVLALVLALFAGSLLGQPGPWLAGALAAAVGVLLVAGGRGRGLRLRVTVQKGEAADTPAAAAVLARLQELGSSPPRGLKTPQQTDVTDLPHTALSTLPEGKVAAAMAVAAGLLLPSVPWKLVVDDGGDDRVTVTLTRNGSLAATAVIDPAQLWRRPPFTSTAASAPDRAASGEEGPGADVSTRPVPDRAELLTRAGRGHPAGNGHVHPAQPARLRRPA